MDRSENSITDASSPEASETRPAWFVPTVVGLLVGLPSLVAFVGALAVLWPNSDVEADLATVVVDLPWALLAFLALIPVGGMLVFVWVFRRPAEHTSETAT